MGYFSNGSEGDAYEQRWCSKCINRNGENGCVIMVAHALHNYAECNNEGSILHLLIPRGKDSFNEKCSMFLEGGKVYDGKVPDYLRPWAAKHGIIEVKKA